MRFLLCAVLLAIPAFARGDDAAEAKAIIEKAVKARGDKPGETTTALTWKDKGTFTGGGFSLKYTGEWAYQAPDKYRFAITAEIEGKKQTFVACVNGDKAWEAADGMVREITGDKLEYSKTEAYQFSVMTLTPLLTEKGFTLATVPGKDIDGKPAVGVKVTREKRPAMTLYFDKGTGLLAKVETTARDEFQMWKEVPEEAYYSDYKEIGGRKYFTRMKVVRDGKVMLESEAFDQKTPAKLDPKLFEKP